MGQLAKIFHTILPRNNSLCFAHRDYNTKEHKVESSHLKAEKNKSSELFRATPMVTKCGHREGGHVHRHFDHQIGARTVHCSTMCTKHTTRTHTAIHARFASCIGVASGDERALTNHLGKRIIASLFIPSEKKKKKGQEIATQPISLVRFAPDLLCTAGRSDEWAIVVRYFIGKESVPLNFEQSSFVLDLAKFDYWEANEKKNFEKWEGFGESIRSERIFSDCRFLVCDSSIKFDYSNREEGKSLSWE